MRRFEKIISLTAVIGMLLHAGLLVRHNAVMLDAAFDQLALSFAGGVLCHGDGDSDQARPALPRHSGALPDCPVCVGAASAAAILPPMIALPGRVATPAREVVSLDRDIAQRPVALRPPSRAPPSAI